MSRTSGFTLIEVLITLAVVAILAMVALPSYNQYVLRANITEAVSGLSDMRVKLEQYFQDQRRYTGACAAGTTSYASRFPRAPRAWVAWLPASTSRASRAYARHSRRRSPSSPGWSPAADAPNLRTLGASTANSRCHVACGCATPAPRRMP